MINTDPSATAPAAPGSATEAPSPQAGEGFQCPECAHRSPSETGLKIHWRLKHKGVPEPQWTERPARRLEQQPSAPAAESEPAAGVAPMRSAGEWEAIRASTVESLQTLGGWAFVIGLQVTGVALDNRADRLSFQAIAYAQRSERFCRALEAFNQVMSTGELAKIGGELGMAVGVDLGVLHPAKPVRFGPVNAPGFLFLRPIQRDIAQVAQLREVADQMMKDFERQAAAAQAAANGIRPQDAAAGA